VANHTHQARGFQIPQKALLLLVGTGLGLILGEVLLRAFQEADGSVRHLLHPPDRVTTFRSTPEVMPGIGLEKTQFTTNEAGLRGEPLPRSSEPLRVVTVGGSTTEALFVDDPDAWPQLLQERLSETLMRRLWVGNAGKSGLTALDNLVQVYYYARELQPQMIVLQAGINDLNTCISGNIEGLQQRTERVLTEGPSDSDARRIFFKIVPEGSDFRLLLLQATGDTYRRLFGQDNHTGAEYVVQDRAGSYYEEQRQRRAEAIKVGEAPNIRDCLVIFEMTMEAIVRLARENRIRLVFLTHGSLYRKDMSPYEESLLWYGAVGENLFAHNPPGRYYSVEVMAELLQLYNLRTVRVARANGVPCLRIDLRLPKNTAIYYDDVHFNTNGSRQLGALLARFVVEQGLVH